MAWAVEKLFLELNCFKQRIFCSVKNFINLLCVDFFSNLSILDRREIDASTVGTFYFRFFYALG